MKYAMLLIPALVACHAEPESRQSVDDPVARGKYLVTILACNDCHTPMRMGPKGPEFVASKFLSGHPESPKLPPPPKPAPGPWNTVSTNTAFAGPWGITYAANLTPDRNTGLGIWTEEMFIKALRSGRHMATSRPLMPPMPWEAYGKMTDEDLKAVFAYLQTIPAVVNHVPEYEPPPGK
jgi:mono/diheme cytochrome c family protein